MNLAERGLLRGTKLFNRNENRESDRKQCDDGSLKGRTERLSIRAFSCIARVAWPVLLVTIIVYCWLGIESLSYHTYNHHVEVRQTNSIQRLEDTTFICPCKDNPEEVNDGVNNSNSESKENTPTSKGNNSEERQLVTVIDQGAANKNGNGSYFTKPVDKHDYSYIHNPELLCKQNATEPKQIFLLIMILSEPQNAARRDIIRSTYGNEKEWQALMHRNSIVKSVFLLGKTNNETLQTDIDKEFDLHGDIIQEDFTDCRDNLTMKTVMGLKWVTNHCRHATYVTKCDDTSVIIQPKFHMALMGAPSAKWAAGQVLLDAQVVRDADDEYYISKDFYAFPTYPPYMSGRGYILSTHLVEEIYKIAITTPLFPWEDVFIGMCLQKLDVTPTNIDGFIKYAARDWTAINIPNNAHKRQIVMRFAIISNLDPNQMTVIWELTRISRS